MKYCPTCRTQYTDDSLRFCLQDGSNLVDRPESETPTIALPETPTVTRTRTSLSEQETRVASGPKSGTKSNVVIPVLITVFIMLGIFVGAGIGLWFYVSRERFDPASITAANTSNSISSIPSNQGPIFPSPTVSQTRSPGSTTTPAFPTPPPTLDTDQARNDVARSIDRWKSMAESRDLNAYMGIYGETVDYYRRPGASRAFVRADKARAFGAFDSITIELSKMSISIDGHGTTATAIFDKEWDFRGRRTSSGKVQQQLRLRNINGQWLITGERDLRVYYTR